MKLIIEIDGESAINLFAAGPNDLRTHFIPNGLLIHEQDIRRVEFREVSDDDPFETTVHADNYHRDHRGGD